MKKRKWTKRALIRYFLLQLPGLAVFILALLLLQKWFSIPQWLVWLAVFLWVAKDAALFPFLWKAYDNQNQPALNSVIGKTAFVEQQLSPSGYVRLGPERWLAELEDNSAIAQKGEQVRVKDIKGLTLVVKSIDHSPAGNEKH